MIKVRTNHRGYLLIAAGVCFFIGSEMGRNIGLAAVGGAFVVIGITYLARAKREIRVNENLEK